jgi:hypothetical protein
MTAPLTLLRTLLVCLATALLIACESDSSNTADIPEINSFHIYTADQTIYSFNEETRISNKRGEFDSGDNQFVELDTDESKPGFDYAVYAFEKGIFLLDYDKSQNGKITKLTQYATDKLICGIIPTKTASRQSFTDGKASNRSTLDLPVLTIELAEDNLNCDPLFNLRDELDFSEIIDSDTSTSKIRKTAGSAQSVLGGLVINYASGGSAIVNTDQDLSKKGSIGFMGYDLNGSQLIFNYSVDGVKDSWSTAMFSDPGIIPFIQQVSNQHLLVQNNTDLFVVNAATLFEINAETSDIPVQSRIDKLFEVRINKDPLSDTSSVTSNRSQNPDTFLVKHNNTLLFYKDGNFAEIPTNQIQNETKIDFDLTSDNKALVIQENPDSSQTLLFISTISGESTTLLTAEKIELQVIENEFYINTLELEAGAGWQAHWFKTPTTVSTYENSRFIFAQDMREISNTLLLLSSDDALSSEQMIKPGLYKFDKTQRNGRKKGVDENKTQVDFSFGKLNTDVENIELSTIINDKYGKIIITGINDDTGVGRAAREQYYFDPSQELSSQDPEKQSLRLMNRELL